MNHRQHHMLEKIQVQLAAAMALAVVYFALWPAFRPWDPDGPVAFVSAGSLRQGVLLAVTFWILAAVCGLVTIRTRPEGGLLAAMIGLAGVSLHSRQIRALLWSRQDSLAGLFGELILEVLMLAAVLLVAAAIVKATRGVLTRLRPQWVWTGPLFDGSAAEKGSRAAPATVNARRRRKVMLDSAYCLVMGLPIAVILLLLLMRSAERGQILFALFAGFMVAALAAHQKFPTPYSIVAWSMPVLVAVAFYALAATTTCGRTPQSWMNVPLYARALPIDWITVGSGGALLGYWMSERIHESRHFEKSEGE